MGWRFRGNINNGTVLSTSQPLSMVLDNFSLVNKDSGAVTANVYAIIGESQVCIMPMNKSISAGSNYESIRPVVLLATEQIKLQVTGNVDYDFNLSNTEAPQE